MANSEYTVHFPISRDHYTSDACIVWCFDARFSALLDRFIKEQAIGHPDVVKIAGGVQGIVAEGLDAGRESLLGQIEKSIGLHHTKRVILMAHSECGAYGGATDQELYHNELKKGVAIVREFLKMKKLDARVEAYFADFNGLMRVDA